MTTEQQRKILECAAKACGYEIFDWYGERYTAHDGEKLIAFNPLTNPGDTAEMCANLEIDWRNFTTSANCSKGWVLGYAKLEAYDNSRLKAWMYAATMVAARVGGYTE